MVRDTANIVVQHFHVPGIRVLPIQDVPMGIVFRPHPGDGVFRFIPGRAGKYRQAKYKYRIVFHFPQRLVSTKIGKMKQAKKYNQKL